MDVVCVLNDLLYQLYVFTSMTVAYYQAVNFDTCEKEISGGKRLKSAHTHAHIVIWSFLS